MSYVVMQYIQLLKRGMARKKSQFGMPMGNHKEIIWKPICLTIHIELSGTGQILAASEDSRLLFYLPNGFYFDRSKYELGWIRVNIITDIVQCAFLAKVRQKAVQVQN